MYLSRGWLGVYVETYFLWAMVVDGSCVRACCSSLVLCVCVLWTGVTFLIILSIICGRREERKTQRIRRHRTQIPLHQADRDVSFINWICQTEPIPHSSRRSECTTSLKSYKPHEETRTPIPDRCGRQSKWVTYIFNRIKSSIWNEWMAWAYSQLNKWRENTYYIGI